MAAAGAAASWEVCVDLRAIRPSVWAMCLHLVGYESVQGNQIVITIFHSNTAIMMIITMLTMVAVMVFAMVIMFLMLTE